MKFHLKKIIQNFKIKYHIKLKKKSRTLVVSRVMVKYVYCDIFELQIFCYHICFNKNNICSTCYAEFEI